jgi:ABC-type bacteriocin/lantibiotic exporter with double-glycine peptidase domain
MAAVVVIFAIPLFQFSQDYIVEWCSRRMLIDMKRTSREAARAPLRFHQDRRRGDVLARMQDVAGRTAPWRCSSASHQDVVMVCVGMPVLFFISWQLALCFAADGPAARRRHLGVRTAHPAQRAARQEKFADVTQRLLEILSGSR